ncbi:MAG: hypothetical protein FH762_10775 [Firmicutes bacterium]|nr:hypothetical protein [Bacillota bacterium]
MNRKERFFKAVKHEEIDRLPVQLDLSPKAIDKITNAVNLENNELSFLEFFGNHIVYAYLDDVYGKIKKRTDFKEKIIYDEWGIGWDVEQEGTFLAVHPLADLDKYKNYLIPDPNDDELLVTAKDKVNNYSDDYVVCSYQVLCLFEKAWALRGLENFMMDMLTNVGFVEDLLDKITDYQVRIAERYVEIGIDCGRTGDDYGGQSGLMFSPDLWRKLIKPRLKKIWKVYKSADIPVMHHSCGDVRSIIPDMIEMGLDILNPIQPEAMPLEELIQYSSDLTFYGGLSMQHVLPFGSTEEVKQEVKNAVQLLGKNNAYIIAPSNTINSDVPIENVKALLEGIEEYNKI